MANTNFSNEGGRYRQSFLAGDWVNELEGEWNAIRNQRLETPRTSTFSFPVEPEEENWDDENVEEDMYLLRLGVNEEKPKKKPAPPRVAQYTQARNTPSMQARTAPRDMSGLPRDLHDLTDEQILERVKLWIIGFLFQVNNSNSMRDIDSILSSMVNRDILSRYDISMNHERYGYNIRLRRNDWNIEFFISNFDLTR